MDIVGWVEQRETHLISYRLSMGFAALNPIYGLRTSLRSE